MSQKIFGGLGPDNEQFQDEIQESMAIARSVNTKCIARLRIKFPGVAGYRYGTGFLYGNNVIATAAHCIFDPRYGGKATEIQVIFSQTDTYTVKPAAMHAPAKWLAGTSATMSTLWMYDYGVLTLTKKSGVSLPGVKYGFLDYQIISDTKLKNYQDNRTKVCVPGYPYESDVIENSTGVITDYGDKDIYFSANFVDGKSGSPLMVDGTDLFIAIANYNPDADHDFPSGTRITAAVADFLDLYY